MLKIYDNFERNHQLLAKFDEVGRYSFSRRVSKEVF